MIVTVDGPAGSGKSTVARLIARRLEWIFLDTGAMYRAVAWQADRLDTARQDADRLAAICRSLDLDFQWSCDDLKVFVGSEDVTDAIRAERISALASKIATVPQVREALVAKQREQAGRYPNVITEGRDQGSVAFPNADLKVFLDASVHERARRRYRQLCDQHRQADYQQILEAIETRDSQDRSRSTGPLIVPQGAVRVDTTTMSPDQVVTLVLTMIERTRSI